MELLFCNMTDITDRLERLESIIEQQQETIQAQQERIEELESERETADSDGESDDWIEENVSLSRRSAIKTLGLAGLLGYGSASAAADPTGQVGRSDRPVTAVYTESLAGGLTGGTDIDSLLGSNLVTEETDDGTTALSADTVDVADVDQYGNEENWTNPDTIEFDDDLDTEIEDGTVSVDADTSGNSQTDVSDDGSNVVESTGDIDFGANLVATDNGDGTATIDADVQGATNWQESDSDDLLETVAAYSGIDVADIQTDSLNGGVTGNTDLASLAGDGLTITSGALGIASDGVGSTELVENSVTVAGNSVPLGGSTGVDYIDLGDTGGSFPIPTSDLADDSVTVSSGNGLTGGGEVSLGESTTLDIDTGGVGSDELATNAVTKTELDSDSVESAQIASGAVGTDELDAGAVAGSNLSGSDGTIDLDTTIELNNGDLMIKDPDNSVPKIRLYEFVGGGGSEGNIDILARNTINIEGDITPKLDDTWDLGSLNNMWSTVYAANGVSQTSDARLKQNIATLSNPLNRLRDIHPVSYEWNDRKEPDTRLGFVAQELDDTVPEAVDHPDDEDGYLGVNYDMVLPVAVGAIQEQQEEIAELEAENERLETRLERVEAELGLDTTADRQGVADD